MNKLLQALDRATAAKHWLIALDRDGTLVPYARRPEEARVDEDLRAVLDQLADQSHVDVAVISARSVAQLRGDFWRSSLIFAGSYGLEMHFSDGKQVVQPAALEALPGLHAVRDELATLVDLNSGAIIEDHGYSLCLHWHLVPEQLLPGIHCGIAKLQQKYPALSFRALPTSYEVLPAGIWDKGAALQFLATALGGPDDHWFYFYAGDSESDTPAFSWVNEHRGISVRVGGDDPLGAQFVLPAPEELHQVLRYLSGAQATSGVRNTGIAGV